MALHATMKLNCIISIKVHKEHLNACHYMFDIGALMSFFSKSIQNMESRVLLSNTGLIEFRYHLLVGGSNNKFQ